jgi:hypothetical protein
MFNRTLFLNDVKNIHLKPNELPKFESVLEKDVRLKLDEFLEYDKALFSKALDDVCNNFVGNTMFRLLVIKMPAGQKVKVVNIGPNLIGESLTKQKGSSYDGRNVKINLNVYDSSGIGIPERQYYCADAKGQIVLKLKSVVGSLFHEFTHCLHHIEEPEKYVMYSNITSLPKNNPWGTKEERRTISGYIEKDTYTPADVSDPICDNCFSFCDAMASNTPYIPRVGHEGYVKGESMTPSEELIEFHKNPTFPLAWPKKYLLAL